MPPAPHCSGKPTSPLLLSRPSSGIPTPRHHGNQLTLLPSEQKLSCWRQNHREPCPTTMPGPPPPKPHSARWNMSLKPGGDPRRDDLASSSQGVGEKGEAGKVGDTTETHTVGARNRIQPRLLVVTRCCEDTRNGHATAPPSPGQTHPGPRDTVPTDPTDTPPSRQARGL